MRDQAESGNRCLLRGRITPTSRTRDRDREVLRGGGIAADRAADERWPGGRVIGLYTAAEVRAAEEPLLASTPEGTLMQRAATGLATVCLGLLVRAHGTRVTALVGAGNNGGDALFAGAHLARRGARVTAVLLDPER